VTLPDIRTLDSAGRTLAWREAGQGPALVLLHGIGGASASWEYQFDYFSDRFRVIAWDMPGYGASDGFTDAAPSVDDYVAALTELLDALDVTKIHIVGQSIAALIAARYAATYPSRTLSFTFAHGLTGYGRMPVEERATAKAGRLEVFDAMGPMRFAYEKGPAIMSPSASDAARETAVGIMSQVRPAGFHQAVEMLAAADFFADARQITVPSLVLCGADDPVAPLPVCRSVMEALSDGQFHLLPDVGHYSAIENPPLFNKALDAFL
jgi:pimeloyl-ACP methyl ester carboxylesterase